MLQETGFGLLSPIVAIFIVIFVVIGLVIILPRIYNALMNFLHNRQGRKHIKGRVHLRK